MLQTFLPVARAQQNKVKSRVARRPVSRRPVTRCPGGQGTRRRGAREPAGFGGARHGGCGRSHHENPHARRPCRNGEPPAGRQVISPRLAPEFDDHGTERRASRSFQPCLEGRWRIPRPDEQQKSGVEPQFRQPCRMRHARLMAQCLMPRPERCLLPACHAQHHGEGRQAHAIGLGARIEFMQGTARERKAWSERKTRRE
jgi:hypothetical protein